MLIPDESNSTQLTPTWSSVARRRTDLVPTIPARRAPGRAYSMTRLDKIPYQRPLHSASPSMHHLNRTRKMPDLTHLSLSTLRLVGLRSEALELVTNIVNFNLRVPSVLYCERVSNNQFFVTYFLCSFLQEKCPVLKPPKLAVCCL